VIGAHHPGYYNCFPTTTTGWGGARKTWSEVGVVRLGAVTFDAHLTDLKQAVGALESNSDRGQSAGVFMRSLCNFHCHPHRHFRVCVFKSAARNSGGRRLLRGRGFLLLSCHGVSRAPRTRGAGGVWSPKEKRLIGVDGACLAPINNDHNDGGNEGAKSDGNGVVVKVHLCDRFQKCATRRRALAAFHRLISGKWLGFVATAAVDGAQALGSGVAQHMAVFAAHLTGGKLDRDARVVAGLCDTHSAPRLFGGAGNTAKRALVRVTKHVRYRYVIGGYVGDVSHVRCRYARPAPLRDGGAGNFEFFSDPGRAPRLRVDPCV